MPANLPRGNELIERVTKFAVFHSAQPIDNKQVMTFNRKVLI